MAYPPSSQASRPPSPPSATSSSLPTTQAHNLLTAFNTFLTVSVHNILYYRGLYPPSTFLSAKAFNLPVHQSRHPKVCRWVQDAVDAVAAQLATGRVERVAVVLHAGLRTTEGAQTASSKATSSGESAQTARSGASAAPAPGAVLERWLFDVSAFPAWPGGADAMRDYGAALAAPREDAEDGPEEEEEEEEEGESDAGEDAGDASKLDGAGAINWADVDEQFRGAMARLAHTAERMAALPPGCTFTIVVQLGEAAQAPIGHPQPWIPSQPSLQISSRNGRTRRGRDVQGVSSTPIRSVHAGPLFFECWVEEGKAKAGNSRRT